MKKTYVLSMATSLLLGVFIGYHARGNETIQTKSTMDNCSQIAFYDNMIQNINAIEIYDNADMTEEILTNRDGKIIVEKIVGKVTNYKLDGKILNCNSNNEGYMSYKRVDGAKENDTILTYYIYNPFTNEQDDVLTRLDFIIDDNGI